MSPDRTGTAALIRFEHVSCSYGASPVVEDVTISVRHGEFVGIVGPSGAGKTTLLRLLLGVIPSTFGRIEIASGIRIGYVPQTEPIDWNFPVTACDVVSMAISCSRWTSRWTGPSAADRLRAMEVLERLGMAELAGRHISTLSGGQRQRVFVARALLIDPTILVLDEPAAGLDVAARHEVLHLLADLHHSGTTIVLTTHDLNGLAAHLPRLVCFNRTVVADGPPAEVLHPYVLERTYGAPMSVLHHGGMPVVLDAAHGVHGRLTDSA